MTRRYENSTLQLPSRPPLESNPCRYPAAAHDQRVVDLLTWKLHALGVPVDDVLGLVRVEPLHVLDPRPA